MPKIYNEIVIDMNPESPTFKETLYEDSFEYSGDMMLMQNGHWSKPGWRQEGAGDDPFSGEDIYKKAGEEIIKGVSYIWYDRLRWKPSENKFVTMENNIRSDDIPPNAPTYTVEQFNEATGARTEGGETTYGKQTEYGAPSLKKEDFFNPDGSKKEIGEIAQTLKDSGAKGTLGEIIAQLELSMPQLEEIDPTKAGFYAEQYGAEDEFGPGPDNIYGTDDDPGGIAGQQAGSTYEAAGRAYETAGTTKETMLSGLQTDVMSLKNVGMRGKRYGTEKIKESFEKGQDIYGLAGETYGAAGEAYDLAEKQAGLDYRKGMYGLGEAAYEDFESEIENIFFNFKKGGRVPSKESFSKFLTQLPDAGGM